MQRLPVYYLLFVRVGHAVNEIDQTHAADIL